MGLLEDDRALNEQKIEIRQLQEDFYTMKSWIFDNAKIIDFLKENNKIKIPVEDFSSSTFVKLVYNDITEKPNLVIEDFGNSVNNKRTELVITENSLWSKTFTPVCSARTSVIRYRECSERDQDVYSTLIGLLDKNRIIEEIQKLSFSK